MNENDVRSFRTSDLVSMAYSILSQSAVARGTPYGIDEYEQMPIQNLNPFIGPRRLDSLVKFNSDQVALDGITNYSRQALKKQTVYLAPPRMFNDPYDCVVGYDEDAVLLGVLTEFSNEFGLHIDNGISPNDVEARLAEYLNTRPSDSMPRLMTPSSGSNEIWSHLMYYSILLDAKGRSLGSIDAACIDRVIKSRLSEMSRITESFCVACFTTTVENTYMWGHYANGYRGFAVEYNLPPTGVADKYDERTLKLISNMWDVFYVMNRPLCTKEAIEYLTSDMGDEWLRQLYVKALCAKGLFWSFENECRLILPAQDEEIVLGNGNVPFFPVKRVFLGQSMSDDSKREIIDICKQLHPEPQVLEMVPQTSSFAPQFHEVQSQ